MPRASNRSVPQPNCASILLLHRVGEPRSTVLPFNEQLSLPTQRLAEFLADRKQAGFRFVTMTELVTRLRGRQSLRKCIALTFDDGYLDSLTELVPLLEAHEVPACVYVTTDFTNSRGQLWWYALEDAGTVLLASGAALDDVTAKMTRVKQAIESQSDPELAIRAEFPDFEVDWRVYDQELMTWDDARALEAHPLVEVGAHSVTHSMMSLLDDKQAYEELSQSKEELESHLGCDVVHYAYPFGHTDAYTRRDVSMAEQVGYKSAVTTNFGWIWPRNARAVFELPRLFLTVNSDPKRFTDPKQQVRERLSKSPLGTGFRRIKARLPAK